MKYQMEEIIRLVNRAVEMEANRKSETERIMEEEPVGVRTEKRNDLAYSTIGAYQYFIREIGIFARLAMEENPS